MTNYKRYILVSAMAVSAMAGLQAQTYNDTVRTHTWSVFAQGGLSYWRGMRGGDFYPSRRPLTPDFGVGVKYNIKPWVRVGLKAEYTMVKSTGDAVSMGSTQKEGYMVGDRSTTLNTTVDRVQNRNNMNVLMADLHADFNVMDIWHDRKAQKFNLWVGTGVGYWHGWNRHSQTFSYREEAVAKGDGYFNVYNHNYLKSQADKDQTNALYIPVSIAAEYDITPCWTAGVYAEGKLLPLKKDLTPKGIAMAGVRIAYNFVGKKVKSYKSLYEDALAQQETLKRCCADKESALARLAEAQRENDKLKSQLADAQNSKPAAAPCKKGHVVYFDAGKYDLSASEKIRLDQYIAEAKESDNKLLLVGEASKDGSAAKNQALSEKRLQSVLSYLNDKGIKNVRIGEKKAIGAQAQGDETYRRVVIGEE